uniref:Uncharacterized protein n=1 Tax=Lepeophtheirus salmonis TaxID=72036 RepID=A0A0K2TS88_LEPSM
MLCPMMKIQCRMGMGKKPKINIVTLKVRRMFRRRERIIIMTFH